MNPSSDGLSQAAPLPAPGGLRRLRQGNLASSPENSSPICTPEAFESILKTEVGRIGQTEETLLVARVRHRQLPGRRGSLSVQRSLPAAVAERVVGLRPGVFVAAVGGEEFAVLVSPLERRSDAEEFLHNLVDALAAPIDVDGLLHYLSPEAGGALFDRENATAELLLEAARLALVGADATHRAVMFHPYQRAQANRQTDLEEALRAAVLTNKPNAVLQPSVDLETGCIEALKVSARWQRDERGFVPPNEIVSAAESIGVTHLLGRQVLQRALFITSDLVDEGLLDDVTLWWTVLPEEILHPEFAETIVAASQVNPRVRVGLELSPTPSPESRDLYDIVSGLAGAGVRASIGDFGIGRSNLDLLEQLPFDSARLHRRLTEQVAVRDRAAQTLTTLVDLAASFGLETTADGIEQEAQADVIRETGCSLGRGFHIAKPMFGDELRTYLSARTETRSTTGDGSLTS